MIGRQNTGDLSALGADQLRRHWKHVGGSPSDDWSTRRAVKRKLTQAATPCARPWGPGRPSPRLDRSAFPPAEGRVRDHWSGSNAKLEN